MGDDLPCYTNEIKSVSLRKCPHDRQPTDEAYLSDIRVTNISNSFTHKIAAKASWHRYGTKLRHCMYKLSTYQLSTAYATFC